MTHPQKIAQTPKSSGDGHPLPVAVLLGSTVRNWRDVVASGLYRPVAGGRNKPDALVGIMGDKFIWDDAPGYWLTPSQAEAAKAHPGAAALLRWGQFGIYRALTVASSPESSPREHISLKPPVKAVRFTRGTVFRGVKP